MSDKFDLEKAFEELDAKVSALEDPEISLEDSFKIYEEGMGLLKKCSEAIDDVEQKVMVLEQSGGTHEFQRQS